jgi:hypothetical protein
MFALGARLGKTMAELEQLSAREVAAWFEFFDEEARRARAAAAPAANDDEGAVELRLLSREALRGMFNHGRRH